MNGGTGGSLTVRGAAALGPLSVEVVPEGGDPIEFALSSNHDAHEMSVGPGRYAIIARRPNGTRLRRSVVLEAGEQLSVNLADGLPPSPNEFMWRETERGDVAPGAIVKKIGRPRGVLQGYAAEALQAATSARAVARGTFAAPASRATSWWTLCAWPSQDGAVGPAPQPSFDTGVSFLKIRTEGRHLAVGVVDESGFGPIVMTPSFRESLEITFLAEALSTRVSMRSLVPSGQRSPVALATPEEPAVADLLSALASPSVEHAEALWDQADNTAVNARDYVEGKFEHPAEALLGAHYLLRFVPDRLPLRWADNLADALPRAADGPVIAAWLRLRSRAEHVRTFGAKQLAADSQRLFAEACRRPVTLFARTRLLLVDGLHLYPDVAWPPATAPGTSPADFFSCGAYAGGLEAFWGTDPRTAGPNAPVSPLPRTDLGRVKLSGSTFDQLKT